MDYNRGDAAVYLCHQELRLQNIDLASIPVSLSFKKQDPQLPFPIFTWTPTQRMQPSEKPLIATANVTTAILFLLHIMNTAIKGASWA